MDSRLYGHCTSPKNYSFYIAFSYIVPGSFVREYFFEIDFYNVIIHSDQQRRSKHPGCRARQAHAQIALLPCSYERDHSSSDQLGYARHHREQSVSQALNTVPVNINDCKRNKE